MDELTVKVVALVLLNLTWVAPINPVPLITTVEPIPPDIGANEVTVG